jgi:hypothetical protein
MKKITIVILSLILLFSTFSTVSASNSITNRLKGRLLLQVEDRGRIWYVDPVGLNRYEVTFTNALNLFEALSLGITNADLYKIPIHVDSVSSEADSDNDGFSDKSEVTYGYNPGIPSDPNNRGNDKVNHDINLTDRLKGKLLLQVEDRGRIWYVDIDGKRHEVTWSNLMSLFRRLALGITNSDLNLIDNAEDIKETLKRDAQRINDIIQIQSELELYFVDQNFYPIAKNQNILGVDGFKKLCDQGFVSDSTECNNIQYMGSVPQDPNSSVSEYIYTSNDGKTYEINFDLEIGTISFKAGKMSADESGTIQQKEIKIGAKNHDDLLKNLLGENSEIYKCVFGDSSSEQKRICLRDLVNIKNDKTICEYIFLTYSRYFLAEEQNCFKQID